jgi:hypothetical protein
MDVMERSAHVYTVKSVGTKYIKAGGRIFDKQTLRCDKPFCALFIGTPQEFSRYIRLKQYVQKQMEKLSMKLNHLELEQLEELNTLFERMIDELDKT